MNRPGYDMDIEHAPGIQMGHVFLIVLALHVLVIGGALGYHWMRGRAGTAKTAPTEQQKATVPPEGEGPRVAFRTGGFEPKGEKPVAVEARRIRPVDREPLGLDAVRLAQGRPADALPEGAEAPEAAPKPELAKVVAAVAAVAPEARAAQPEAAAKAAEHLVRKGDMLSGIARKYGVTVAALRQSNGLGTDMIRVGQKLKIPASAPERRQEPTQVASATPAPMPAPAAAAARATAPAAPERVAAAVPSGRASDRVYVVAKGDTLWGISKRFKVPADRLVQTNKIQDPGRLRVGTRLVIPLDVSGTVTSPGGEGATASPSALAMSK